MHKFKNVLIVFAIIVMAVMFFTACPGVVGPDPPPPPPPPEEVEYYDYTVTYVRPSGSIVRPNASDPFIFFFINKNGSSSVRDLIKVNDNEWTGTINSVPTHLKKEKDISPSYIGVMDAKRWIDAWVENGFQWARPLTVGDIIRLKNNQTGAELTLTNIVTKIFVSSWPVTCEPKASQFWTIKGGAIHNSWPY